MNTQRTNPFTEIAQDAFTEIDALVADVAAELHLPLGLKVVPESTRRNRMRRQADELATLLAELSVQFGPDQVREVLAQPVPEQGGQAILEVLVGQYGEDVVRQAFALLVPRLQALTGPPAEAQYLPAA